MQPINSQTWLLERNPYYWAVDTAGNQLPYLDKVQFTLAENPEVINLRAIAGEYDYMERFIDLAKLPVFLENAAARQIQGPSRSRLQWRGLRAEVQLRLQRRCRDPEMVRQRRFPPRAGARHRPRPDQRGFLPRPRRTGTPIPADIITQSPGKEWRNSGRRSTSPRPMRCSTRSA